MTYDPQPLTASSGPPTVLTPALGRQHACVLWVAPPSASVERREPDRPVPRLGRDIPAGRLSLQAQKARARPDPPSDLRSDM